MFEKRSFVGSSARSGFPISRSYLVDGGSETQSYALEHSRWVLLHVKLGLACLAYFGHDFVTRSRTPSCIRLFHGKGLTDKLIGSTRPSQVAIAEKRRLCKSQEASYFVAS